MLLEFFLCSAYTILFVYYIQKSSFFKNTGIAASWFTFAFIAKISAGLLLSLIYTRYYTDRSTADVFKFFDDSNVLFEALKINPKTFLKIIFHLDSHSPEIVRYTNDMKFWYNRDVLFNDNQTMIVLNALFRCLSLGNYSVHVVFINILSFTGLAALFKAFETKLQNKSKELFVLLMFLPSVLLWGSGLLKDSLLLFALGLLIYSFDKLINENSSKKNRLLFIVSAIVLLFTKVYVLLILIPALAAWIWSKRNRKQGMVFRFATCYAICFFIAFNIGKVSDKYDVADLLYYKQLNFYAVADSTKAGSVITLPKFEANAGSIIYHTPAAVARVFVRPSIFDSRSPLILVAAIENLLILVLLLISAITFRRNYSAFTPVFWLSIFFVICLFALTGLTTPVLGAMVRYKVPALPFLMFIVVSIYKKKSLGISQ